MAYWVKRILLKNRKLVAENTLPRNVNLFDGPTPNIGDEIRVTCRGKQILAIVVWVSRSTVARPDSIRVQEISDKYPNPNSLMIRWFGYLIDSILLKNGGLAPKDELPKWVVPLPTPEIGDEIVIEQGANPLKAKVIGVDYAAPDSDDKKDHIRVEEI